VTTRREFLTLVGAGAGLFALGACAPPGPPPRALDAGPVTVDLAGTLVTSWGYAGSVPGPELRVREGERLHVRLHNALPEPTSVHWHGISLENPMDGTPGLTQAPVEPGGVFDYAFTVPEAGTHWYHSHSGHQLDTGLYGALVVEPRREELAYDREAVLLLDDWRDGVDPHAGHDGGHGGEAEPTSDASFGGRAYPHLLVNAHPPADPAVVEVRRGDRLRLRLVNAAADTGLRVAVGGHRLTVTHADGMPVAPVTVDALRIGMGERYDVLVDARTPGTWPIAVAEEGGDGLGRAVLRYVDAVDPAPPPGARPAELDGRLLDYTDLVAAHDPRLAGSPDREFALTLRGTDIDVAGLAADAPLDVTAGQRVRLAVRNDSAKWHPVHLHGHHFRVTGADGRGPRKDTASVPARGGELVLDFVAGNPGDWMLHCHNHWHMEDGMARTIRYRTEGGDPA
jgi:FtsP/CotA-like multicopper oxidase with cupredoxin domain